MIIDIKMYENQIRLGRVKMLPEHFPDAQTDTSRACVIARDHLLWPR